MKKYNKITDKDIIYLREICGSENVFIEDAIHSDFTHDEMMEYGCFMPDVVVEAHTTEQVSQIMKYANENNIPVTPRGSGTGLCGGAVAVYGGILLSLSKMNKIIEFDKDNLTVTLEPGVLLMDLAAAAIDEGLLYPPDPGEKSATVGGNVMTNAGGMRAIKYGVTRDYVRGMTIVLPDGQIMHLGGKVAKNSSGYDLKQLLIGSEGTLGIVTQLIMKLIPLPKYTVSLLVPFNSLDECIDTVPKLIKAKVSPTALEFMEQSVITLAEEYLGLTFPDKSADAYLLMTFDGNTQSELNLSYQKAADICLENNAVDVFISDTEERNESIWKARGAFLEAIKTSTPSMDECDVVVPRNKIAEFVKFVNTLEGRHKLRIRSFGHAGDGNLHIYLCKDNLPDERWKAVCSTVMDKMYEKSMALNGQISGEHGIGHAKSAYLKSSLGDDVIALMKRIKLAFDPNNILNPGKVIQ